MFCLILLSVLAATALSAPSPDGGYGASLYQNAGHGGGGFHGDHDYYAPAYYDFGYAVNDPYYGTNFGHKETRKGYLTSGEYFVNLPDGRIQKVSYYADENGYHPTVTYIGKAHFPETHKGYH